MFFEAGDAGSTWTEVLILQANKKYQENVISQTIVTDAHKYNNKNIEQ